MDLAQGKATGRGCGKEGFSQLLSCCRPSPALACLIGNTCPAACFMWSCTSDIFHRMAVTGQGLPGRRMTLV